MQLCELCDALAEIGLTHDRVATVDALGLVDDQDQGHFLNLSVELGADRQSRAKRAARPVKPTRDQLHTPPN